MVPKCTLPVPSNIADAAATVSTGAGVGEKGVGSEHSSDGGHSGILLIMIVNEV